jgi:hypothetical protein
MPRPIFEPFAGANISNVAQAALLSSQSFILCNLYSFASRVFWQNDPTSNMAWFSFTDADFPVAVNYMQLFALPQSTEIASLNGGAMLYRQQPGGGVLYLPKGAPNDGGWKHSQLSYEVGLAANDVDVTWFPDDSADYFAQVGGAYPALINPPVSILPIKQAMGYYRAFDDCPFWIHRGIFGPTQTIWAGACIGCFTDSTGQIVAGSKPFLIGSGVTIGVPVGATQLQMGMTDYPYDDNTGSWVMDVNGSNVTVDGTAAPWVYVSGGLNNAYPFPSTGQSSPTIITGLSAGETIRISYVSGLVSLHFATEPFFTSLGAVGLPNIAYPEVTPGMYAISTQLAANASLLGTALMWRGFIRKTEAAADYLKISIGSLMQILQDTPVPNQIIEANTRSAPFLPFPNVSGGSLVPLTSGNITRVGAKTYTMGWVPPTGDIVTGATLVSSGNLYKTAIVTVSGGGGSGCTMLPQILPIIGPLGGAIISLYITNPGRGYTSPPTITITDPTGSGSGASYTATIGPPPPLEADGLQDCWVTFNPAPSGLNFAPQNGLPPQATPGWRIQANTVPSGSPETLEVTFYDPPIVPGIVDNIILFSPNGESEGPGNPFPFVPPPEPQLL